MKPFIFLLALTISLNSFADRYYLLMKAAINPAEKADPVFSVSYCNDEVVYIEADSDNEAIDNASMTLSTRPAFTCGTKRPCELNNSCKKSSSPQYYTGLSNGPRPVKQISIYRVNDLEMSLKTQKNCDHGNNSRFDVNCSTLIKTIEHIPVFN